MKTKKAKKGDVLGRGSNKSWVYNDTVKKHFLNPKNILLDERKYKADAKGASGNPLCGDVMAVWIKVDEKTRRIKDCQWRTYGCGAAIASTSMMSVILIEKGGMPLEKALDLKPQDIVKRLGGLPDVKFHCSILGLDALKQAINDYLKKQKRKK